METKKLDEIINNLEALKRLDEITESGEETLTELKAIKQALSQHDVTSCVCPNEIKTGTVSIHCCNLCGKPDEDWWGKH